MATDFSATRKLSQDDAIYQQLEQAHTDACKAVHAAESAPKAATYKLQRLLLARDAVLHFAGETECTDPSQDEFLERATANSGEAWAGMWYGATEDLTEMIYDLCAEIHQQRLERDQLIAARDAALQEKRKRWSELEAQPVG